jgi:hypothetical protein
MDNTMDNTTGQSGRSVVTGTVAPAASDDSCHSYKEEHDSDHTESDTHGPSPHEPSPAQVVGKEQTRGVVRLRLTVLVVLLVSAIGLSAFVYSYLANAEKTALSNQFSDDAAKVMESIRSNVRNTFASMDSIAVTLVSHAQATNQTWPFVTLPNFAVRMAKALPQGHSFGINVVPIVNADQREEWEAYSIKNDYWVNENMAVQESSGNFRGPIVYDGIPNKVIVGDFGEIERNLRYEMLVTLLLAKSDCVLSHVNDWLKVGFSFLRGRTIQ